MELTLLRVVFKWGNRWRNETSQRVFVCVGSIVDGDSSRMAAAHPDSTGERRRRPEAVVWSS